MWITSILYLGVCAALSDALVNSWTEWPGNGYLGLSVNKINHSTSVTECKKDGGSILIYENIAELNDIIASFSTDLFTAWISSTSNSGNCKYVLVYSSTVQSKETSCDSTKNYLCQRPADAVISTTLSTTEMPITTTTTTQSTSVWELTTETTAATSGAPTESTTTMNVVRESNTSADPYSQTSTAATLTNQYTTNSQVINTLPGLQWNVWIPWTECTATCNTGSRFRMRLCASDEAGQSNCSHILGKLDNVTISYATEWDLSCNSHPCPIWTEWSVWNACSATCDSGTTKRQRTCLGEETGKFECPGKSYEVDFCHLKKCPVYVSQERVEEKTFKESDSRPSAIGLGSLSLIFVLIEFIMILIIDSVTITAQCRYLRRNLNIGH